MAPFNIKDRLEDDILDLSMMSLKEIPIQEIAALKKKVRQLDLSSNEIESLPRHFAPSLSHITKLDLGSNKLTQLPPNFGELNNLKHLDLYNNQLKELPISFNDLQELRWIDLKSNPLRKDFAAAAGDCSDYKECTAAAKNILHLTMRLKKDHEHQLMVKEKQRKAMMAKNEEKEKKKLENQRKKAMKEKEMRDKETESKESETRNLKNERKAQNGSAVSNGHKKGNTSASSKSTISVKKARKNSGGFSRLAWINFVLFVLLLVASSFCFYIYSEGDISIAGGYKALDKLETNFSHLLKRSKPYAELAWAQSKVIGGRIGEATYALGQSLSKWFDYSLKALEGFAGDMSPIIESTKKICASLWSSFISIVLYAVNWSKSLVDFKVWSWVLEELKYFGLFLWAQVHIVYEEIMNSKAIIIFWEYSEGTRQVLWNVSSSIAETSFCKNLFSIIQTKVVPEISRQFDLLYNWVSV